MRGNERTENSLDLDGKTLMAKKYHVTTTVNGDEYDFLSEAQQSLLDTLRDELMLSGTKEGCATGDCGACTVMVDGTMVCSCLVLAVETQRRQDRDDRRHGARATSCIPCSATSSS